MQNGVQNPDDPLPQSCQALAYASTGCTVVACRVLGECGECALRVCAHCVMCVVCAVTSVLQLAVACSCCGALAPSFRVPFLVKGPLQAPFRSARCIYINLSPLPPEAQSRRVRPSTLIPRHRPRAVYAGLGPLVKPARSLTGAAHPAKSVACLGQREGKASPQPRAHTAAAQPPRKEPRRRAPPAIGARTTRRRRTLRPVRRCGSVAALGRRQRRRNSSSCPNLR